MAPQYIGRSPILFPIILHKSSRFQHNFVKSVPRIIPFVIEMISCIFFFIRFFLRYIDNHNKPFTSAYKYGFCQILKKLL